MKFETFESIIQAIIKQKEADGVLCKKLENIMGEDSCVMYSTGLITDLIKLIEKEYKRTDGLIEDFIYEHYVDNEDDLKFFIINDIKYKENIKNLWLYLRGEFDKLERF